MNRSDSLYEIFDRQREFMGELVEHDRLPEFPVDLTTKPGQRIVKEMIWNLVEEMAEASFVLKNRQHKITDDRTLDFAHFLEELGDAFAFFVEVCILSGIGPTELFAEYCRKNETVRQRLRDGY